MEQPCASAGCSVFLLISYHYKHAQPLLTLPPKHVHLDLSQHSGPTINDKPPIRGIAIRKGSYLSFFHSRRLAQNVSDGGLCTRGKA